MSGEGSTVSLSGKLDVTAEDAKLRTQGGAALSAETVSATANTASVHATDASLSLSGKLDAFVNDGDILASGDIAVRSGGDLSMRSESLELESDKVKMRSSDKMDMAAGSLKFRAQKKETDAKRVTLPLNCESFPGGCASLTDADSPAMLYVKPPHALERRASFADCQLTS